MRWWGVMRPWTRSQHILSNARIRYGLEAGGAVLPGHYPAQPAMPFFRHEGSRLAYTIYGDGPRTFVLVHGAAALAEDAPPAGARPGRARQPGGDARPARSRAVGPPAGHDALLDAVLRAADDRPARPSRGRRGGAGRHLAGRERDARGRGPRARARARHGRRDARARQRAAGLRHRLHAADDRPDLRRARHAPRQPAARDWSRAAPGRCWPTSAWTPSARTRRPARRSCTGCSSAARRRTRRSAARSRRRRSSSATRATPSTPSATPTRSSPSCRTAGSCRPARSSSCASLRSG